MRTNLGSIKLHLQLARETSAVLGLTIVKSPRVGGYLWPMESFVCNDDFSTELDDHITNKF